METIPDELIIQIGYMLPTWNDIWSYTMVFKKLRKDERYARFARTHFEVSRSCNERFGVRWGDERCRHTDRIVNPDEFEHQYSEHWLVEHMWIDYNCDFRSEEYSETQWCYLPYGATYLNGDGVTNIDGVEYLDDHMIMDVESVQLPTIRENLIKELYDNHYIKLFVEANNRLKGDGYEIFQNYYYDPEDNPELWIVSTQYDSEYDSEYECVYEYQHTS